MQYKESRPLLDYDYEGSTKKTKLKYFCGCCGLSLLAILFLFTLLVSIFSPILWKEYNTAIAQTGLNAGTITIDNTTMQPYEGFLLLNSITTFAQTGSVPATIKPAEFKLYYEGKLFATAISPELNFKGDNEAIQVEQTLNLTIVDDDVFRSQAQVVMKGGTIYWRALGNVKVSLEQFGISISYDLLMDKLIQIVGRPLIGLTAYDTVPLYSTDSVTLFSGSTQSFYNPSNIAVAPTLGNVTLRITTADDDEEDQIDLGFAIVPDFKVDYGLNAAENIISSLVITDENRARISQLLSAWAMGQDQKMRLRGPVNSDVQATYMWNTSDNVALLKGNPNQLLEFTTFEFNLQTKEATLTQTINNWTPVTITQSDVLFQTFLSRFPGKDGYIGYVFNSNGTLRNCPSSITGPYVTAQDTIFPPNSEPQTNLEVLDHQDECQVSLFLAACCYSINQLDQTTFMTSTSGSFNISIDQFAFRQDYAQEVPFTCTGNFPSQLCGALFPKICPSPFLGAVCTN
eukprot:TRINITY_DN240_c1_g3_i1.p1 TRINITY_DN240_c1_g3~~TRINITY_DN240_c1_g3_i1.p1  ORF type:complete len:529 (-),score=65.30 TRINITY_DN240_c1_g3_i1:124-1668(-)